MTQSNKFPDAVRVFYALSGVSVPYEAGEQKAIAEAIRKMKRAGISSAPLHFRLYKKSVDARKRDDIRFVCTVLAEGGITKRKRRSPLRANSRMRARKRFSPKRPSRLFSEANR